MRACDAQHVALLGALAYRISISALARVARLADQVLTCTTQALKPQAERRRSKT